MNTKGIKKKVTQWYEKNKLAIGVGLGAAGAVGTVMILGKKFDTDYRETHIRKSNKDDIGLFIVGKNIFGKSYEVAGVLLDPDQAKSVADTLIEATSHSFEELIEISGWNIMN